MRFKDLPFAIANAMQQRTLLLHHLFAQYAGSTTNLIEDDQAVSYAFLNTNGGNHNESDTVVAMTFQNICRTFRHGEAGRRSQGSIVWLQHRTTEMQKLYPQVFENYAAQAGDTYEIGGNFYIGELLWLPNVPAAYHGANVPLAEVFRQLIVNMISIINSLVIYFLFNNL
ncbi:hypothetical protein [Paenibacillus sp. MBLB4367]|uniref:hypothetical protein n=1 Tax=Paenibacillus sp. MBLB4367 TaxID=3384767 RepID=UPI00390801F3